MLTLCNYWQHVHKDFETGFFRTQKMKNEAKITISYK